MERPVLSLSGHVGAVNVVRLSHDQCHVVSGGGDRSLCLWSVERKERSIIQNDTRSPVKQYTGGHGYAVNDVLISSRKDFFISCGGDQDALRWDVESGTVTQRFRGHTAALNSVAMHETQSVLATASYDQTVRLFDCKARSRDCLQLLDGFKDSVSSVAIHDVIIVCGSIDGTVTRFDVRMGRRVRDDIGVPVTTVVSSLDGQTLLTSCTDSTLRLIDAPSGQLLNSYTGHVHSKYKMGAVLANNDSYVVSGSEDGSIYVWDILSAAIVRSWTKVHIGAVLTVACQRIATPASNSMTTQRQSMIISGGLDGNIHVWQ